MFITRVYSYDGGSNTIGLGWRVVLAFNELSRQRRVATRQGKKVIKERVASSIPVVSPYNLRVSTIALEEAERGRLVLSSDRRLKLRDIITTRWKLARHLPIEVRKVLRKAVQPNRTRKEFMANKSEDLDDVLNEDVPVDASKRRTSKTTKAKEAAAPAAKAKTAKAKVAVKATKEKSGGASAAAKPKTSRKKTVEVTPVEDKPRTRKSRKAAPAGEEVKAKKSTRVSKSSEDAGVPRRLRQPKADGYRGHRTGSLVEKAHKLFDDKLFPRYENGKMNRPAMAEHLQDKTGIADTTARTWVYKWTRIRESESAATAKLAARQAKREAKAATA